MDPNTLKLLMGSAGAGVVADKFYIEDVFSTYLYTGNGSTQTITNGIDLSGKGGLVWLKNRTGGGGPNAVYDTARGTGGFLRVDSTAAVQTIQAAISSFNSNGFSLNSEAEGGNENNFKYVSWTFRKAAKFFDVVTFTTSTTNTNKRVSHSLGSTPGLIIVKNTVNASNWLVYHRSLDRNSFLWLNSTTSTITFANFWGTADPTSTDFGVNETAFSAGTWVAYVFAHDAGGFGDSGNDNVISCGSYTGNGSTNGPTVTLGWEPQWLLVKRAGGTGGNWFLFDSMRGIADGSDDAYLQANQSDSEILANYVKVTSTGFAIESSAAAINSSGTTFVYIAIRRGPMKTPTDATKVFSAVTATGSTGTSRYIGFPSDFVWARRRDLTNTPVLVDRLRGYSSTSSGSQPALETTNTGAENAFTTAVVYDVWNDTVKDGAALSGVSALFYHFRRAPGFFDVVAYTGDGGTSQSISHNLRVIPEFVVVKRRNSTGDWVCSFNNANALLNSAVAFSNQDAGGTPAGNGYPSVPFGSSSTVFSVLAGQAGNTNANAAGSTYIAYLFATCPGVSKVGSYTGSGTTKQIDCGFTNGARFVLIKRTDSTGDWYVWDTARGIVSGNDPFLFLNSTAAENTATDYIDPLGTGFEISSTAPAAINANGGSFFFLAVA